MVRRKFDQKDFARNPSFDPIEDIIQNVTKFYAGGLQRIKAILEANDQPVTQFTERRLRTLEADLAEAVNQMRERTPELVDNVVTPVYADGLQVARAAEGKKGIAFGKLHQGRVNKIAREMQRSLTDGISEIGRWVDDGLREVQLQALAQANVEGLAIDQQKKRLTDLITERNLSMPRGYRGNFENYVDMVARTNLAESNRSARLTRTLENGISLVQISAHGATDTCGPFEGAIISLVPNDQGIPTYDELRTNRATHIFGPNCRHERLIPVKNPDRAENKKAIEQAQSEGEIFRKEQEEREKRRARQLEQAAGG